MTKEEHIKSLQEQLELLNDAAHTCSKDWTAAQWNNHETEYYCLLNELGQEGVY